MSIYVKVLPSLHSSATRDSRLSICICSLFSVRSLSRDLRLQAIRTTTMKKMSNAPAAAMPMIAVLLSGLSDVMWTTPGENSIPPTRALSQKNTIMCYNKDQSVITHSSAITISQKKVPRHFQNQTSFTFLRQKFKELIHSQ